jgi:hypothetical protein
MQSQASTNNLESKVSLKKKILPIQVNLQINALEYHFPKSCADLTRISIEIQTPLKC